MKTLATLILALTLAVSASAQTNQAQTTLNGAVTADQLTVRLTSATGVVANTTGLLIDLEYFTVTGVSGTLINVMRGQSGTVAAAHATAAKVQVLAAGSVFRNAFTGPCTLGEGYARYQPIAAIISPTMVFLQACRSSAWMATYVLPLTLNSVLAVP